MANDAPQHRTPKPRTRARLDPLPRERRHIARCGRCGQFLWTVEEGDGRGPSWLKDLNLGWRFDPGGRISRPTETHLAQRRAANARVLTGTATESDRVSLRHNGFGRRGRRSRFPADAPRRAGHFAGDQFALVFDGDARFGATADLPVAIQCPRCGVENDVGEPVAWEY